MHVLDGEEAPSAETPVGDFFCNGFNTRADVLALPINVNPSGGLNCYSPMPFRRHARITVQDRAPRDQRRFFYAINYALGEVEPDEAYFHAQFRRTNPLPYSSDYVILDGAVEFPTICGTGTEDCFGNAWGFGQTYSAPFLGYPLGNCDGKPGNRHGLYRCDGLAFCRPAPNHPNCSMNPCPCGHFGDPSHECTCSLATVSRYQRRIHCRSAAEVRGRSWTASTSIRWPPAGGSVARVEYDKLTDDRLGEPSEAVRARVLQRERFSRDGQREVVNTGQGRRHARILTNADMGPATVAPLRQWVREQCRLDDAGRALLRAAVQQLGMSARAFRRILKLARTIADSEGVEAIRTHHLAEALRYRPRRA